MYPPIVDQLVDLVTRLAANDRALDASNRCARPQGAEHLHTAEEIARCVFAFERQHFEKSGRLLFPPLPRLTADLRLPQFAAAHGHMLAWPPEPERIFDKPLGVLLGHSLDDLPRKVNVEAAVSQHAEA